MSVKHTGCRLSCTCQMRKSQQSHFLLKQIKSVLSSWIYFMMPFHISCSRVVRKMTPGFPSKQTVRGVPDLRLLFSCARCRFSNDAALLIYEP